MTTNQSYGLDARLRRILMPVSNLDQALATYAEVLVISLLHRDGANYAAVGDGSFRDLPARPRGVSARPRPHCGAEARWRN